MRRIGDLEERRIVSYWTGHMRQKSKCKNSWHLISTRPAFCSSINVVVRLTRYVGHLEFRNNTKKKAVLRIWLLKAYRNCTKNKINISRKMIVSHWHYTNIFFGFILVLVLLVLNFVWAVLAETFWRGRNASQPRSSTWSSCFLKTRFLRARDATKQPPWCRFRVYYNWHAINIVRATTISDSV